MSRSGWDSLTKDIEKCTACPRLVTYRQDVASQKVKRFSEWEYWGRPVPAFGDTRAWLLILGLAPAAHGANRTGRMFTGDHSGDFLYAALHRAGLANQKESQHREDGLFLSGVMITASARCAPPENRPSPQELARCAPYLDREVAMLLNLRVVLVLGQIAFQTWMRHLARVRVPLPKPRPKFAHGEIYDFGEDQPLVVASYHVSRQNTQTGRLTDSMFDEVLEQCIQLSQKNKAIVNQLETNEPRKASNE